MSDWYDHAHYFDLLFRDETDAEVKFFKKAFKKFASGKVRRLIEPGCGSGRLVRAMALKGYEVTGVDLNPQMLSYLDRQLAVDQDTFRETNGRKAKLNARTVLGDMTNLRLPGTYDAAFCTFNTFRHMMTEQTAVSHLRSVANQLRVGGIYILGFHIIPLDAEEECTEKWKAKDNDVRLKASLKVVDFDRKNRRETLRIKIKAKHSDGTVRRVEDRFPLRLYTHKQVRSMLASVCDVFEIAGIFDFDYAINHPRKFNDDLTDALFVLRRR